MTEPTDAVLRAYAERLLTGTGLAVEQAEACAAGTATARPEQAGAAAAALRDGWRVAERANHDAASRS